MNKPLLLLLLITPNIYTTKPEAPSVEIVDIDLASEQSTTVDKVSTHETVSKTTRKLKLKVTVFAALGSFLTGTSALIWKYIKK